MTFDHRITVISSFSHLWQIKEIPSRHSWDIPVPRIREREDRPKNTRPPDEALLTWTHENWGSSYKVFKHVGWSKRHNRQYTSEWTSRCPVWNECVQTGSTTTITQVLTGWDKVNNGSVRRWEEDQAGQRKRLLLLLSWEWWKNRGMWFKPQHKLWICAKRPERWHLWSKDNTALPEGHGAVCHWLENQILV